MKKMKIPTSLQKLNPFLPLGEKFVLDPMVKQVNFKVLKPGITMKYTEKEGVDREVKIAVTEGVFGMVRDGEKYKGEVNVPIDTKINLVLPSGGLSEVTGKVKEALKVEAFLPVEDMLKLVTDGSIEIVKLIEK